MKNVLLYSRVATSDSSFSLAFQEETMIKYCNENNYNIVKSYKEVYSGKDFNRPQWKLLMSFIKNNNENIDKILVLRFDRFSRNLFLTFKKIESLKKLNVEIECIATPIQSLYSDEFSISIPEVVND